MNRHSTSYGDSSINKYNARENKRQRWDKNEVERVSPSSYPQGKYPLEC